MMTAQEARVVCRIMCTADGGCDNCVRSLLEWFGIKYPEHQRIAEEMFCQVFNYKLTPGVLDFTPPGTGEGAPNRQENAEILGMATQADESGAVPMHKIRTADDSPMFNRFLFTDCSGEEAPGIVEVGDRFECPLCGLNMELDGRKREGEESYWTVTLRLVAAISAEKALQAIVYRQS